MRRMNDSWSRGVGDTGSSLLSRLFASGAEYLLRAICSPFSFFERGIFMPRDSFI